MKDRICDNCRTFFQTDSCPTCGWEEMTSSPPKCIQVPRVTSLSTTLSCSAGLWNITGVARPVVYHYKWWRKTPSGDWHPIHGETSNSLDLSKFNEGDQVQCAVTVVSDNTQTSIGSERWQKPLDSPYDLGYHHGYNNILPLGPGVQWAKNTESDLAYRMGFQDGQGDLNND